MSSNREPGPMLVMPPPRQERGQSPPVAEAPPDFSLVLGGPLFQLLRRAHLSGTALEQVRKRIGAALLLTWVPLLVLSVLEGNALGGSAPIPFLRDVAANVRFLVALPLLIAAELVVHRRMHLVVGQFIKRHLIPDGSRPQFDAAIASALRLRNSVLAEVLLMTAVYVVGGTVWWRHFVALDTTITWYATPAASGITLTLAGRWFAYVSLPLFQFLLLRWYYRILIWMRFLWQVSHIDLGLIPTHPDRVGGLGFLANIAYAFIPLGLAHGAMVAGPIANRILYLGATLPEFKADIALAALLMLFLSFGPLLVFSTQLSQAKREGLRDYGALAEEYVREFDTKWLRGGARPDDALLGSGDIQSLADLGNSFDIVKGMRFAPITRDTLVSLLCATLAPIAPLMLTMMSLEDLLKKALGAFF